jgi:tetratricopeptide (TPR) repeat protein
MAGRWFQKWSMSGCLAVAAIGCNKNSVQTDTQPITGMPMASQGKSLWGNSNLQASPAAEIVSEPPKKGPVSPETEVAFGDVRMAVAFDEKTPEANRAAVLDSARHFYQKALQQDPKNRSALLGLARYYSRVGERDKTLEMYQKYLSIYPGDREVTYEIARVFARWQDWNNAVVWCDKALKIDPENLTFRKTMGFCLACGGRWEEAFAVFLKVMPEAQARYTIARVMEDKNFVDASRQQLQLALQADPTFIDARTFLAEIDQSRQPPTNMPDPNGIQRAGYVPEQ